MAQNKKTKRISSKKKPYKAILLFGPPGSGKGTQGKILGAIPRFHHCSAGDMFRALDKNSEAGRLVSTYLTKGELVPASVTVEVWKEHIQSLIDKGVFNPDKDILFLDGIPRNLDQAEALKDHVDVLRVIQLDAPDEKQLIGRLRKRAVKENRKDDADINVTRHRLDVYRRETKPLLKSYPRNKISHINALQPPLKVLKDVLRILNSIKGLKISFD